MVNRGPRMKEEEAEERFGKSLWIPFGGFYGDC